MGDISDFVIGQTVELPDGRIGTVRFAGSTQFAQGEWLGVELEDNTGKNDGAVQGYRYFDCDPGRGMFVRPGTATIIDQPTPKPTRSTKGTADGTAAKTKPPSKTDALRRQSVVDQKASKRQSINAGSPTPSFKAAASASRMLQFPSKSPTKQLSSRPSSGAGTLRNPSQSVQPSSLKTSTVASKPRVSIAGRQSTGTSSPPISRTARPSKLGPLNGSANMTGRTGLTSARKPANRLSTLQSNPRSSSSISEESYTSGISGQDSFGEGQNLDLRSPPLLEDRDQQSSAPLSPAFPGISFSNHLRSTTKPTYPTRRTSPATSQPAPPVPSTALSREIEDLKTKLKLMEKKRMEDREKFKALEKIQTERDRFENIIQKLQAKYQPQQQEITDLKRQVREAEAKAAASDNQQADNDTALEMAALDREFAEETAESLKAELEALKQKHEELELEVEILREENVELGKEMSPEERTSQGWLQMERSNERLREALMRLRDLTQEQEAEYKQHIKELENDTREMSSLRARHEETKERLEKSDAAIEDLRQQLDSALGSEEMIEELEEKNMSLNEQVDDMRAAIEDLESLKELNDELEIHHIETEKQMQDDIDMKDSMFQEQIRKSAIQDEKLQDLEYTVTRFRELAKNLHSDLEDMKSSKQITESEANELSSRATAMLDMNMRLQASASKAQVKAIDLELRRLEAQESAEHLKIVQLFLPETFSSERDSIKALLCFSRIEFKASLLHGSVKERVNSPAVHGQEDEVFASCDILDHLIWVSAMCNRFQKFIYSSSPEIFEKLGRALYDLEPVEKAFNLWIDALKQDEFKSQQCRTELQRSIALMAHLAEVHMTEGLQQYAEEVHMRALMMQSNLENAATAFSNIRSITHSRISSLEDSADENGNVDEDPTFFFQKADSLIMQIRNAKVVCTKSIHQLGELKMRSLTLSPSTLPTIEQTQSSTSELLSDSRNLGLTICGLLNEEGRTTPFTYSEIMKAVSTTDSSPLSSFASKISTITNLTQNLYSLTTSLTQTVEFPAPPAPPPWEILAQRLRAASTTSAVHEKEVERLKYELSEKNTDLALKNKVVEELSVNVEVLEKRVSESSGRRERLRELEASVENLRQTEKDSKKKLIRAMEELQALEAEREKWKRIASDNSSQIRSGGALDPVLNSPKSEEISVNAQDSIISLKAEIASLQSTVRYLRIASHNYNISSSYDFLTTPLLSKPFETLQTLLAHEARDAAKSLLALVTSPQNQLVEIKARKKSERLQWHPMRESAKWQIGRQREHWEAWQDWKEDIGKRRREMRTQEGRKRVGGERRAGHLPLVGFQLPRLEGENKDDGKGVEIYEPEELEGLQRQLGIA